ncbi:HAD-IC family P-type ATPase [Candidatus Saccharibacteria bacterium]|nr:HAD-IC family P-type ATPase [Candidatus Saccharibacteria bacterium]
MSKRPSKLHNGLSATEVRERRRQGLVNTSVQAPSKSIRQIIIDNTFTYFNLVFLVLAIFLILVGAFRDITFMPVIIANTLIGIFQEIRSKVVLDKMSILNAPTARVIRDGKEQEINAEWLVQDDLVRFVAGNQIPADAEVVSGSVAVNESLLTGESDDIHKEKGDGLLSGSFIVSGECYARLTKVGKNSYISQLTLEAKREKIKEQSEIIRSLNKIVTFAGIAIIPIGIILFCQQFFGGNQSIQAAVQASVAAMIGMIPEGLFLLSSVALAISAMELAQDKVLPHDMKSIETLARVDVLCVDKTGTITDAHMKIASLELPKDAKLTYDEVFAIASDYAAAQTSDNITMEAVKEFFDRPSTARQLESAVGFSPEYKYSGVNFTDASYLMGAPDLVLGAQYDKYRKQIEGYNLRGYRVLAFCRYRGKIDGKALTAKRELIGLILLTNPIRANAPETFRYFADQKVRIMVISGDAPLTVSEVAKKAGIANATKYIDASTLTSEKAIRKAIKEYTVFGRVTPDQKRQFVRALQAQGHTVGMTGDGVNDILALRDADCGIAMASGSDAAMQAAQLVLLESDFSKMPGVVRQGRQVVNNLERSGSLFLVKNTFSLTTSLVAILLAIKYPILPAQISLISMFTIGVPGFLLSQLPNNNLIKGSFIYNILSRAVPGGLTDMLIVAMMMIAGAIFGFASEEISTASTILLGVVGMQMVYRASKPMTKLKWAIFALCLLGQIVCYAFLPQLFGLSELSLQATVICVGLSFASYPILQKITNLSDKLGQRIQRLFNKYSKRVKSLAKEMWADR